MEMLVGLTRLTIQTTGNATDFGDLTYSQYGGAGMNDGTRGVSASGMSTNNVCVQHMCYVTMDTTGNATDFGDKITPVYDTCGCSDQTRGIMFGGYTYNASGFSNGKINSMEYITIQTTGNATDFGDLSTTWNGSGACSNGTRGCVGGGGTASSTRVNTVEYITIQTTGNSSDFGDLTVARNQGVPACSGNAS